MAYEHTCLTGLVFFIAFGFSLCADRPHIIFIVADDMGYNDVGWNNPEMKTPHLDELARNGIIMNQSYVQPLCTPSRAAFMTGYYPYHLGRQNCVVIVMEPTGISTKHVFLPEKLKQLQYSTHIIGKWHLGHCNVSYTPTYRGFDSFLGLYYAEGDYYKHTIDSSVQMWREILDFHKDLTPTDEFRGVYTTDVMKNAVTKLLSESDPSVPLFLYLPFQAVHAPLQVPNEYKQRYSHIQNRERRIFSGMVSALDDAVGSLVADMKRFGFWDNFLIVFISDNGADVLNGGNNWPLRGSKMTLWEGGTRVPTFVYGDILKQKGYVNENMIHAVDWFPTLLGAAGTYTNRRHPPYSPELAPWYFFCPPRPAEGTTVYLDSKDLLMDGVNQWDSISGNGSPVRNQFVYNIYDIDRRRAAIRMGDHKLILGYPGLPCDWVPVSTKSEGIDLEKSCRKTEINEIGVYLYNIKDDPLEKKNLAQSKPALVKRMKQKLQEMSQSMVPADDPFPNFFAMRRATRRGALVPGWCEAK